MEDVIDNLMRREFVSVWVRDPQIQREDFWHAHIDYEICIHTNSMCFTKKTSCVRRRYSEFVWLRQKLQENALLMELPELPPRNPFFSLNNAQQIGERMRGLQHFLEVILQNPLVLSDSCLHLFLQSQLSVTKMEACASGQTRFSVEQAIQRCGCRLRRFHSEEELHEESKAFCDSDCESSSSSGLGHSTEAGTAHEEQTPEDTSTPGVVTEPVQGELSNCLSELPRGERQALP
ncbi:sorting nexin-10B-like [Megalops cyprinoides]|uniref:sorting nexin-10B-like n=1 Tax=Megalops cyprinoides TaxID=118141 RepID=UPI0018649AD8|nr:sorting nexin-10B-like [Megalops cyprinoides]